MARVERREWPLKCAEPAPRVEAKRLSMVFADPLISLESPMKSLALLFGLAVLAACGESPTAPSAQPNTRSNLLAAPAWALSAARNPSGTGQPGASCGSANASTEPNGFGTKGFAHAETVYAGSDGTPSQANGNSHAVSQYDVACYQLSNK
jgi:hypothetical protein